MPSLLVLTLTQGVTNFDDNTSQGSTTRPCQDDGSASGDTTDGDGGVLAGNQVDVEADAPVDASGNQVTVVGDENTSGGAREDGCSADGGSGGGGPASGGDTTSGEDGTGSGNQLTVDPDAPVDASGNQVTVLGDGNQSADMPLIAHSDHCLASRL